MTCFLSKAFVNFCHEGDLDTRPKFVAEQIVLNSEFYLEVTVF